MMRRAAIILMFGMIFLPSAIWAQDGAEDYTCDDGEHDVLNAAQAAFDEGDFATAVELAGIAEGLCSSNLPRFRAANDLKLRAQAELDRLAFEALEPGFVEVNGDMLFVVCDGEPTEDYPTVVFESGLGVDHTTWSDIQPTIAEATRTCVYDRLGVGRSDDVPSDGHHTAIEQAETLHMLLQSLEIEEPVVLVGHSYGGLILLAYPYLYSDDVAGLVFVDAAHADQWPRIAEVDPDQVPSNTSSIGTERINWDASAEALAQVGDFGDLPIAIVYQARDTDLPFYPVWLELQEDHAERSTNSRMIPAEHSGHFVQNDEPELVIEAIMWVLDQAVEADEASPNSPDEAD